MRRRPAMSYRAGQWAMEGQMVGFPASGYRFAWTVVVAGVFCCALSATADEDARLVALAERYTNVVQADADPQPVVANFDETRPLGSIAGQPIQSAETASLLSSSPTNDNWLLQTITALGIVIGLIFIVRAIMARAGGRFKTITRSQVVEVLSRTAVAPRSHVILLKVGRRVLIVGDNGGALTSLGELTDADEIGQVMQSACAGASNSISENFGQLIHRFNQQIEDPVQVTDEGGDEAEFHTDRARDELTSLLSRVKTLARGAA